MRIFLRAIVGIVGLAATAFILAEPSESIAQTPPKGTARNPMAVAAEIDRLINARLAEAKLPASPLADDAEFLRRATLDLCGRIPPAERVTAFLADTDPNKRSRAINELLADREYGEHFAIIWYHRMVRPDDDNRFLISPKMQDWLADRFNENPGWDQIVKDILTASGDREEHPETVFWLANVSDKKGQPQPSKITGDFLAPVPRHPAGVCGVPQPSVHPAEAGRFLGRGRFLHQHPRGKFQQEGRQGGQQPGDPRRSVSSKRQGRQGRPRRRAKAMETAPFGSITIPDTKGKTVKATFLGAKPVPLAGQQPLRPLFAAWVTSPKNPYFARAAVNKLWANFFGRGIVDPVDDMRPEAKPTHPELLQLLADEFTASGFDLKHLTRCIANSRTYQRSSRSAPLEQGRRSTLQPHARQGHDGRHALRFAGRRPGPRRRRQGDNRARARRRCRRQARSAPSATSSASSSMPRRTTTSALPRTTPTAFPRPFA